VDMQKWVQEFGINQGMATMDGHTISLNEAAPETSSTPIVDQSLTPGPQASGDDVARALRPAYNRLVERTGSDSVFISDLVNESGLPLPQVQQWLRDYGISQGQATLDTADWSSATEEQRAANVMLRGQERLYVRLHDGVGTGPAPQAQTAAAPQSQSPARAAADTPQPQPQPAQRRRTGGELWRPNQRISEDAAVRIAQALHSLGVTQADIVINDTGWPEGFQRPPAPGSRQGNVIYLNREQVRGDTPLHEVVHGLIPELREKNRNSTRRGRP